MPLELIFEIIFCLTYRLFSNPGLSILTLSLAMNFLVLPLYKRADAIREKEKDKINAMAPWVNHIKKTFKGDERYMILNEYYRQKHYRPIESLRGSLSLILQIPFFIAAYHYLSNRTD
jgi:membrane protein insertase Oxa1/YidC/SpoIIIJ